MAEIKGRIGINDLLEQKTGPIWLVNTAKTQYEGGTEILINIQQGDSSSVFVVPRSWLPIEATKRYPREALLKSQYFMEALGKELITVISAKEAEKLTSGPMAEKEKRRLTQIEEAIKAANSSRGIGKNVMISTGDPERDAELAEESNPSKKMAEGNSFIQSKTVDLGEDDEEEVDPISAQFKAWVIKLNGMEDIDDVKSELKTRGEMEIHQAIYLMKNCDHEEVTDRIRRKLLKLGEITA